MNFMLFRIFILSLLLPLSLSFASEGEGFIKTDVEVKIIDSKDLYIKPELLLDITDIFSDSSTLSLDDSGAFVIWIVIEF
ncbi:MAG: hypothetical protein HWN79_17655 [Candidatus Lokiarchaeota archaeon]|nr:hypothetical protein [Candidatus Lokiarchaeota archaeon]